MINKLASSLKTFFEKYTTYSLPRFVIESVLVAIGIKFVVGFFLLLIFSLILLVIFSINPTIDTKDLQFPIEQSIVKDIKKGGVLAYFAVIWALLITPLLETLTTQALPIWITSKFTTNIKYLLLVSAFVFAALHINPFIVLWTFPVGLLFAWNFYILRRQSIIKAIVVVTIIHALFNTITLVSGWLLGFLPE